MKLERVFNQNNMNQCITNILLKHGKNVVDLMDAIEDSTTKDELVRNVNNVVLRGYYRVDRETETYIRLVMDLFATNKSYLQVSKEG